MRHPQKFAFWMLMAFPVTFAISVNAQVCSPPSGFSNGPHPIIADPGQLVAHTEEEITVAHSLAEVMDKNAKVELKDAIHKAGSLPGVVGIFPLGTIPFPRPGSRHIVCLSDGSTLLEQSLEEEHSSTFYRFPLYRLELYKPKSQAHRICSQKRVS